MEKKKNKKALYGKRYLMLFFFICLAVDPIFKLSMEDWKLTLRTRKWKKKYGLLF